MRAVPTLAEGPPQVCHQEAAAALTVVWRVTPLGTLLFHTSGWMSGEERYIITTQSWLGPAPCTS